MESSKSRFIFIFLSAFTLRTYGESEADRMGRCGFFRGWDEQTCKFHEHLATHSTAIWPLIP
jgi:hypothetical protein